MGQKYRISEKLWYRFLR